MTARICSAILLLILSGCTRFEDAEMTERKTFVHFFSSEENYVSIVAELDSDGGFILAGGIKRETGAPDALIIKTDERGHKLWESVIPQATINAIRPRENGYILVGDSIQFNTGGSGAGLSELENYYAKVLLMDTQGTIVGQHTLTGRVRIANDTLTIDYHGSAFDIDQNGQIIVLGSYRVPGDNESTYVCAFDPSDLRDSLWYQPYQSLDRDLLNCNALHVTPSSDIVWASRIFTQAGNLSREFVGVSRVKPNSTFKTYTQFGETDTRNHSVEDIQPSSVGYCAIGTYAETNGLNGNIYFLRFDVNLNVIPGSERYIDGEDLMLNKTFLDAAAIGNSSSVDEGLAIVATDDGFVLAGSMTSTPTVGNGGKDILLIKVDATGNLLWQKLIGGTGDETITSIRETQDKGLLLSGTNTVNGLSTIMLIRTDNNGNVNN